MSARRVHLKSETLQSPERIRAMLMRRVADRLGMQATCQARACRRNRHCHAAGNAEPACYRIARPEDRARFDELFATVEAIRSLTLWPEPSRNDGLRALEAEAIDILGAALPLMPDFAPKFAGWLKRYNIWPTRPGDRRFWLQLAREEINRYRAEDRIRKL